MIPWDLVLLVSESRVRTPCALGRDLSSAAEHQVSRVKIQDLPKDFEPCPRLLRGRSRGRSAPDAPGGSNTSLRSDGFTPTLRIESP
jgi:hypothetical protein